MNNRLPKWFFALFVLAIPSVSQGQTLRQALIHAYRTNPSLTAARAGLRATDEGVRSEEHTSELQSLMRISYAVFCLKKKILNDISADTNTVIQTTVTYKQKTAESDKQHTLTHEHD